MRIGIDVGGTNTDAVLMDGDRVVAEVKTPTTSDVTAGIVAAMTALTKDDPVKRDQIGAVMIGTTHFTNAIVEAKRLMPTAAVRLGLPATQALPPMIDWPARLITAIGHHPYLCHGGNEFDGRQISSLDPAELRRAADDMGGKGIRSIAITSVFSPINYEIELEAGRIFAEELPQAAISLSHEIGRVGLLERENATILNACLRELAEHTGDAFYAALSAVGIDAPVYLSQNDGTLMSIDHAKRYPVMTFASGPTNSMRGAAFLSGRLDCAVVDIGGTTSDVGVLMRGFPREAAMTVDIGAVRTNFRMPDVYSCGIGGGSLVTDKEGLRIGPESVGYELTSRALCFGGDTLTATDIVVASGLAEIGDRQRVSHLDKDLIRRSLELIENAIAQAVDRMKTSAEPIPVVVVGGGSVLLGNTLAGASELIKPDHFAVANAIGAAIAQIGGEVDRIFTTDKQSRDANLEQAKVEAIGNAVAAGASHESVRIVEVEEVPLTYLPGGATRIRVKAVGDLNLEAGSLAKGS